MKHKANISIELYASNVTIGFDRGHDLDLEFSRSNYELCYIPAKKGLIATKQTTNISIKLQASNVTIGFDRGYDFGLEFSWSNMDFAISAKNGPIAMKWKASTSIER